MLCFISHMMIFTLSLVLVKGSCSTNRIFLASPRMPPMLVGLSPLPLILSHAQISGGARSSLRNPPSLFFSFLRAIIASIIPGSDLLMSYIYSVQCAFSCACVSVCLRQLRPLHWTYSFFRFHSNLACTRVFSVLTCFGYSTIRTLV